ncbi:MAG: glycosyltransferase family 4 protein [Candidatus Micrarchaeia archaeon]
MKICHLDPLFLPYHGGAEKHVFEISRRLIKKGYDITVLTSRLPATATSEVIEGIKVKRVNPTLYIPSFPFPLSFLPPPFSIMPFQCIDVLRQDADIFHIHNRFWYGPGVLLAAKLRGKALILTLHNARPEGIDFPTDFFGLLFDLAYGRRIMELADKIICVSEYTKRVTVPPRLWEKCIVITNGVDTQRFNPRVSGERVRKKLGIPTDAPLILCNARLVRQKGLPYLIDAFALTKRDFTGAKLVVIGKGPLKEELLAQATRLGVDRDFVITTGIPEDELPEWYAAADLFVLPSVWEPCAVVLLEALASGKPIVATNIGGNPELVTRECGLLVRARDADALYAAMARLLAAPALRRKMARAARRRAERLFSWDIVAEKIHKVYQSIGRR